MRKSSAYPVDYDSSVCLDAFKLAKKTGKASMKNRYSDGRVRYTNIKRDSDGNLPFTIDDFPLPD